ncbi:Acyl-coenzyme A thioesterase PaaI, contains HGG motif [Formivibrio citricus]|uniref:Acyl-coenzyme A thioesterase PaaI, contains HGG motif n=1 Tax=Formivibrio citricus TaxID=83765 RepID=A0A1I5BNN2_9NEIS|nr:PaaI family thioesterase [Formivibrio citricus]SFN76226.1 Acyl-coenzyme A thioesterase PaaI, contains HGG motif [Formivibrio citricus]
MQSISAINSIADLQQAVAAIPYACFLGIECRESESAPLFVLPYRPANIGNARLPALHGGVIGGFLENAAILHLMWAREAEGIPKIVDFSIDYLRSAGPQDLFARCEIVRQGMRVANVLITAWQADAARPVATARAHYLLA